MQYIESNKLELKEKFNDKFIKEVTKPANGKSSGSDIFTAIFRQICDIYLAILSQIWRDKFKFHIKVSPQACFYPAINGVSIIHYIGPAGMKNCRFAAVMKTRWRENEDLLRRNEDTFGE